MPFASGIAAGGTTTMFMQGCTSGPCPNCGYAVGDIPDASYRFVDGALAFIGELNPTESDLRFALQELAQSIREQNTDVEAIRKRLDDHAPSAAPLVQLLRDPAVGHVLAAMGILVAVIFGVLTLNQ